MTPAADPTRRAGWARELEQDPGSPAFFPLAGFYADSGRADTALRLCIQGLTHHPEHVEAHLLLGRLYRAAGELEKAFDELDIALHLEPWHDVARRELEELRAELAGPMPVPARPLPLAGPAASEGADGAGGADALDIAGSLRRFVELAGAETVLLVSAGGALLGEHGWRDGARDEAVGVASLAAAIHAAGGALARLLGEPAFAEVYHQGAGWHVFLGSLDTAAGELLLVAATRDVARPGLLRAVFRALASEIAEAAAPALGKLVIRAETWEHTLESARAAVFDRGGADVVTSVPSRA